MTIASQALAAAPGPGRARAGPGPGVVVAIIMLTGSSHEFLSLSASVQCRNKWQDRARTRRQFKFLTRSLTRRRPVGTGDNLKCQRPSHARKHKERGKTSSSTGMLPGWSFAALASKGARLRRRP